MALRALAAVALVLLAGVLPALAGREQQKPPPPDSPFQEQFLTDDVRAAAAAAAVVGMRDPLGAAASLIRGHDTTVWLTEKAFPAPKPRAPGGAPVLDPEVLANVDDKKPVADADVNPDEVRAYHYTLIAASRAPVEALFKDARRDLTYAHLFNDTLELRGQLIHIEGRLVRLRRYEPGRHLKKEGIKDHYEGWVFDKRYENDPASHCIVFTELPEGMKVGENVDYPVAFAGYLFKRYRVRSVKNVFDAPLLIGRTVMVVPAARPSGSTTEEVRQGFLVGFFVVGGVTAAVILGLTWWYRRNDRLVRARLARARPPDFAEGEEFRPSNGHFQG